MKHTMALAVLACSLVGFSSAAAAQAQTPASPAPTAQPRRTVVSDEYDGKTHMTLTPYVWLPTINGTFQFNVPKLPKVGAAGGTAVLNAQVGPNSYLSHLNFAAMGAFEIRKGDVAAFTDYIHLNADTGATYVTTVSGPLGKLVVPVNAGVTGRVASSIWEAGASLTLAHNDMASLELLGAWRQVALNTTVSWNINVGKNGVISRNGSAFRSDNVGDVVFGLRGKVAIGEGGWFVPYYADAGTGAPDNDTWQAYTGIGKTTKNGAFLLAFRELNYDFGPSATYVQKIRFGGPLLGYSFRL